jgi:hypothetical protein
MTLLAAFLALTASWRGVFAQERTWRRAQRQALGALLVLGRATLSRILWTNGREQKSWSGEYFLHSRAFWNPQALFAPLWKEALAFCPGRLVGVAVDDTRLRKTGRAIPQAAWHRDPLSPPFHTNLMLGLRFLQASLLIPLHRSGPFPARAIPIRFEEVSVVKKPGRRAREEAWEQYKQDRKRFNLSQRFVQSMAELRTGLDQAGGQRKTLVIAGDGSFCNRTVLAAIPDRSVLIARTRKDARLCFAAAPGTRRIYAAQKFTPEQVRQDQTIPWKTTKVFYGGKRRRIRYKEVSQVLWQNGGRTRSLRLFVIAPTPYRKSKSRRLYYRDPAYLLSSDLISSARQLIQIYFDRWQIEVLTTSADERSPCQGIRPGLHVFAGPAKKKTHWGSARRSYGMRLPFPNSRRWSSPLTAHSCSPPSKSSAPREVKPMPNCRSGDAMPAALPARI